MAFSRGLQAYLDVFLFIYLFHLHFYHTEDEPRWSCGRDRQVHYVSQEFKVILCLLWLLSGAPLSLRYSNARSPIPVRSFVYGASATA